MQLIARCPMFFLLSMMLLTASCYAADFSADMENKTPEGSFTGKLYISGDKPQG